MSARPAQSEGMAGIGTSLPLQGRFVGGKDYAPLDPARLGPWLAGQAACRALLAGSPESWRIREVGDGNLNLVFIVEDAAGAGLVVKQALPYVRLVGEAWPLPLDRAFFEHEALTMQARFVPDLVPRVLHFAPEQAAIVMAFLTPHLILRKGLIRRIHYPRLADDLARFLANTLFFTSDFAMPAAAKKSAQAIFCQNTALCKISEDLIFTDPYRDAPLNRWTRPQLDAIAQEFAADAPLKIAVQGLKWAFLTRGEALLHGDLHTGSVMVTPEATRVIDPEFAFFGPIGFDIGALLANLMLNYLAQDFHPGEAEAIQTYKFWLMETIGALWHGFEAQFLTLWRQHAGGDAFPAGLFDSEAGRAALDAQRQRVMAAILADALGFAGTKMVRRILGLAHVEDFEAIADPNARAIGEIRALLLARALILEREKIASITEVCARLRDAGRYNIALSS